MTKTYFGYIRVSTKKQGNGASLPEQKAAIEAYAVHHGLEIIRWFCETRTAAKTGRREFQEMLRELKRKRASGVIIHKVDRGARNGHDWADIGDLADTGIDVRIALDDLDISTRGGRLMADIQAVVAADFVRNNRQVVKLCMEGWLKAGYYPWPAPPGYLNKGKHQLKDIDPVRGPLVARAFELYAGGTYGLDTLRAELARQGLTARSGKPLSRGTISTILRNPFYVGTIRMRRSGAFYEGKHPPLISQAVFDRVQALLNGRVFAKAAQDEFRFRRLIRCDRCPRTLTGERQKGRVYYRCHSRTCHGVSVSEARVDEDVVLPLLDLLQFDDEEMQDVRAVTRELMKQERGDDVARLSHFDRDLAKVAERLERITDAMLDGLLDKQAFNERKAALLGERTRLAQARAEREPSLFWAGVLKRFERGNVAQQQYIAGSEAERREALLMLGSNFVARGNELEITIDFPFLQALEWSRSLTGALSHAHVRRTHRSREEIADFLYSLGHAAGEPDPEKITYRGGPQAERACAGRRAGYADGESA